MRISIGKIRRLQQCATDTGQFIILAMDHRGNLRRALQPAAPETVDYGEMVAFKRQVAAALSPFATAILLDPVYGAAQAVSTGAVSGRSGLVVAVEKTGYTGEPTERESQILPGWSVAKIARMGASAVKLLVYYHPEAPNAAEQERLVKEVGDACARHDIPFFLEPLSYSLTAGKKKPGAGERRAVVVETARRLTPLGVDVLKAEFPVDHKAVADEGEWADACRELSEATVVPWVLLSAGVSFAEYERQTLIACEAGASGVMAGRAVWKEASELDGAERTAFLLQTAKERLQRVEMICRVHGRPWATFYPELAQTAARIGIGVMAKFDLLVIGEINPDLILRDEDIVPAFGQVEKLVEETTLTIGSSSAIMACGAARLGLRTAFLGVVGDDLFGRYMLEAMADRGVDTSACIVHPSLATGISVILTQGDDRAILTHLGAIPALAPEQVDRSLFQQARHVHCGSYFLLRQLQPGLAELFAEAQDAGASTSLDTNWDPAGRWDSDLDKVWPHCDLFMPNAAEAKHIAGAADLEQALDRLARQVSTLAVKLGATGGLARQGETVVRQPAFPVEVVDAVGAGDSFDAGFLYGYLQQWSLSDSLRLANACGALSTRASGGTTAQPTLAEAQKFALAGTGTQDAAIGEEGE